MFSRDEILDWVKIALLNTHPLRGWAEVEVSQDRGGFGVILDVEGERFVLDVRRA